MPGDNSGSTVITGQDLLDQVNGKVGAYANVLDSENVMKFINEGKDAVWSILKNLDDDYFNTSSQATDNTQNNYFATLVLGQRQYTLPADFKEIRFIEASAPSGYGDTKFIYKPMSDPIWR